MAYLALYRAWRPQIFGEVVGQESTVTALRNAVREGKIAHAYLFSGPRGTGKTSVAKIVAKAVNCDKLADGEPCNSCSACVDINKGNFMDVIEIDAASNRGIDEIRDLREKVRILPAQGKVKVYIIDEVHMLTTEAFNALLKTLEEPPGSVVFILATTEPQKIPKTICSRCQIYNFRRLTAPEIIERLKQVAIANDIHIDRAALQLIARRSNGGMRDALSMLDQIYSYKGGDISKKDVLDVLGLVDDVFLARLMDAVFLQDFSSVIKMLGTALVQGKEAQQLVREAALYLRDLLLYMIMGEQADFSIISEESKTVIEGHKKRAEKNKIIQAIKILIDTADKLRFSEGQKFLLEMAFIEIASLFGAGWVEKESGAAQDIEVPKGVLEEKKKKTPARESLWNKILTGVKEKKIPTHALLSQGKLLGAKDNTVFIGFKKGYKFHKERMEEKANREIVETVLKEILNQEIEVQFIFLDDERYNNTIVKKAVEYFGEDVVEIKD
ncbi:MAG: DNA polymerase III subunit gamma/tau [Syntrophomonadaceae bacterium]|nr:DNA polymerase III subunit gamma/tau [Syntrophomonadaceae bacterium]